MERNTIIINNDNLRRRAAVPTGVLAVLIIVAVEIMFFGGLISSFLVQRMTASEWPPPGQPNLPVLVTAINSIFLIISAITIHFAVWSIKKNPIKLLTTKICLFITLFLGIIFIAIQGYEWIKLLSYENPLTINSSLLGAYFYTIIGAHGLHVIAGLVLLIIVITKLMKGKYNNKSYVGLSVSRIYWFFVVGLWPILYFLVYLL
ncbi:MAG: heme-copper oxidase subunit III [Spirochaetota bacterium]|nr:heme-copper oxidase subunit III [Spirochaetota bacterium]